MPASVEFDVWPAEASEALAWPFADELPAETAVAPIVGACAVPSATPPLTLVHSAPDTPTRTTFVRAIELLQRRGFTYIGHDPVGLPCYRSPSGALLIAVGSCRSLAYAPVSGKLQVVAAARTAALVCRITVPGDGIP